MQARTAPTSPAAKKQSDGVVDVWKHDQQLARPYRTPWGRIVLLCLLCSFVLNIGVMVGYGWFVHRYPTHWLSRYAPMTTTTTTTVVQQQKETTTIPAAVERISAIAYTIAKNQGGAGVYRSSDGVGIAWPLSSSGWTISVSGAWPSDMQSLVLLPSVGSAQAVTSTLADPGSSFTFLKTTELSAQPMTIADADALSVGATVWVVDGSTAVSRRVVRWNEPRWSSSDQAEAYVALDAPVNMAVGAAIVMPDGRWVGVLGNEQRVWPVSVVSPIVKNIIQQASIARPTLGLRVLDRSVVRTTGQSTSSGFIVGADEGQTAIVVKGPADKAGVKSGDVIVKIDGHEPTTTLFDLVNTYTSGAKVSLDITRSGVEKTFTVTLGTTRT